MAKIQWSLTAEDDLHEIELFITRDSIAFAVYFVDGIIDVALHLKNVPKLGRVVPELNQESIREIIYRNYRIIYLLENDSITILRVVHSARDFKNINLLNDKT